LEHDGNLLFLGDINPGGSVVVSGDLYVMGALRGMAHAGSEGNEHAVIAASHLFPTQLRIAGFISRPPDEWLKEDVYMEFAFLEEGQMKIDKLSNLSKRKQLS
jgi:septum site-determining protein MinC